MLWLKLTPTYFGKKGNNVWRKKHSSDTLERTEENNCLDCLQPNNGCAENYTCE